MRGFLADVAKSQLWVYRKDNIFLSNTRNVGSQRDFYGDRRGESADFAIGEAEEDHSAFVTLLRSGSSRLVDSGPSAAIVRHLQIRTENTRSLVTNLSAELFESAQAQLSDTEKATQQLEQLLQADPSFLVDALVKGMGEHGVSLTPRQIEELRANLPNLIPQIVDMFGAQAIAELQSFVGLVQENVPGIVSKSHNEALVRHESDSDLSNYETFFWRLLAFDDEPIVLGDCCVIAIDENGQYKHTYEEGVRKSAALLLPVSFNRLLIGTRGSLDFQPSISELNEASAQYSQHFFVANNRCSELENLATTIGTYSPTFEMDSLFDPKDSR